MSDQSSEYSDAFKKDIMLVIASIPMFLGAKENYGCRMIEDDDGKCNIRLEPPEHDFITPSVIANYYETIASILPEEIHVDYENEQLVFSNFFAVMLSIDDYVQNNPDGLDAEQLDHISTVTINAYKEHHSEILDAVDEQEQESYDTAKWPISAYAITDGMNTVVKNYDSGDGLFLSYYEGGDGQYLGVRVICGYIDDEYTCDPDHLELLELLHDDLTIYKGNTEVKLDIKSGCLDIRAKEPLEMLSLLEKMYEERSIAGIEDNYNNYSTVGAIYNSYGQELGAEVLSAKGQTHVVNKSFKKAVDRHLDKANQSDARALIRDNGVNVLNILPMAIYTSEKAAKAALPCGAAQQNTSIEIIRARIFHEVGKNKDIPKSEGHLRIH